MVRELGNSRPTISQTDMEDIEVRVVNTEEEYEDLENKFNDTNFKVNFVSTFQYQNDLVLIKYNNSSENSLMKLFLWF